MLIIIHCKSLTPALQAETKAANRCEEFDGFLEHELRAQADAFRQWRSPRGMALAAWHG
jgi:hypothetical protein